MGKIVVTEFISMVGVSSSPAGPGLQKSTAAELPTQGVKREGGFKVDETMATDALLLGRDIREARRPRPPREASCQIKFKFKMPKFVVHDTGQARMEQLDRDQR
jgi:hypothetical protein